MTTSLSDCYLPTYRSLQAQWATGEKVNARDLKSLTFGFLGSSPRSPTVPVVKLENTLALGASAERLVSSSLTRDTCV